MTYPFPLNAPTAAATTNDVASDSGDDDVENLNDDVIIKHVKIK